MQFFKNISHLYICCENVYQKKLFHFYIKFSFLKNILEILLAPLGRLLGLPWPLLGLSWLLLGASWLLLGASWLLLGASWPPEAFSCLPDASQKPPRYLPDAPRSIQMPPEASRCLPGAPSNLLCFLNEMAPRLRLDERCLPDVPRCFPDAPRSLQMPPRCLPDAPSSL